MPTSRAIGVASGEKNTYARVDLALSRLWYTMAACAMLGVSAQTAAAQGEMRCPVVDRASSALANVDARDRLAFVRESMRDQARRAKQWSVIWAAAGLGLAAGSYTQAALAKTADDRLDPLVGGTTSLFIPAAILVQPLEVMEHQATLETELASLPTSPANADLCAALAEAERLFAASAANEAFAAGLFTQLLVIGGNGAVAAFLGLGYGHWEGALVNGGGGLIISELQIFTQPTGAISTLSDYRAGRVQIAPSARDAARIQWAPLVGPSTLGITLFGSF